MIVAIQMTSDARPSRAQVLTLIDKYSTRVQYANGLVVCEPLSLTIRTQRDEFK